MYIQKYMLASLTDTILKITSKQGLDAILLVEQKYTLKSGTLTIAGMIFFFFRGSIDTIVSFNLLTLSLYAYE